jgi:D-glycero-alpha-D-manno-heptose-7-phosphate kinase
MIITQTPLRITLGGGGTDLASYYSKHEGFLVSGAIDKYVFISVHETFGGEIHAHYSQNEKVMDVNELKHPIIREALKLTGLTKGIEMFSIADIPAGTGLGSSGCFTVGLLKALHTHKSEHLDTYELADEACKIEIDILGEPIGKQDQFACAFGGLTGFTFQKDGKVIVEPLKVEKRTLAELEENMLLFFTNVSRKSYDILREQDTKSKKDDNSMMENLHKVKELGYESKDALESGDLKKLAELMDTHWHNKKKRSGNMTNPDIDKWYELARENGALGGKLVGAGGGGFLMLYANDSKKLRDCMEKQGLREVRFRYDFEGSKVLVNI